MFPCLLYPAEINFEKHLCGMVLLLWLNNSHPRLLLSAVTLQVKLYIRNKSDCAVLYEFKHIRKDLSWRVQNRAGVL